MTLDLADIISMAAFHHSIVTTFVRWYADWALQNLAQQSDSIQTQNICILSPTEEFRITLAFYRFESNLFGLGPHKIDAFSVRFAVERPCAADILACLELVWEPWELEEILCLYLFIEHMCEQVFDMIRWDVDERNRKFAGQSPPTPDGAFALDFDFDCST